MFTDASDTERLITVPPGAVRDPVRERPIERACLLGDAAFVTRPHIAVGTSKAVGDAVQLADSLARHRSMDDARTAYGARFVTRSRRMGDDRLGLS